MLYFVICDYSIFRPTDITVLVAKSSKEAKKKAKKWIRHYTHGEARIIKGFSQYKEIRKFIPRPINCKFV